MEISQGLTASNWIKMTYCSQHAIFPSYFKNFADVCVWIDILHLSFAIKNTNLRLTKSHQNCEMPHVAKKKKKFFSKNHSEALDSKTDFQITYNFLCTPV